MKSLLLAIQFLTIVPVRVTGTVSEDDMVKSSRAFVVVGLLQGILLVAIELAAGAVFHHDLVLGLVLFVLVLSNGGFHLDGLADTCDAVAVRGDREKKLSVMKDGSIGPAGVIATLFSLGLKYLALKNMAHLLYATYYTSLLLLPVVSKWAMVVALFHGSSARGDGLGRIFIGKIPARDVVVSTLILVLLLTAPLAAVDRPLWKEYLFFSGAVLCSLYLICRMAVGLFHRQFGGITGDTVGAISEVTEVLFLLMVITWSRLST